MPSRARVSNPRLYRFNKFTRLLPPVVAPAAPPTIPTPTFARALPKYQGQSTAKRGCAEFNASITSNTCGTPYANYTDFEYAPTCST